MSSWAQSYREQWEVREPNLVKKDRIWYAMCQVMHKEGTMTGPCQGVPQGVTPCSRSGIRKLLGNESKAASEPCRQAEVQEQNHEGREEDRKGERAGTELEWWESLYSAHTHTQQIWFKEDHWGKGEEGLEEVQKQQVSHEGRGGRRERRKHLEQRG